MRRDTDGRQARDTAEAWREGGGQVWAVHYCCTHVVCCDTRARELHAEDVVRGHCVDEARRQHEHPGREVHGMVAAGLRHDDGRWRNPQRRLAHASDDLLTRRPQRRLRRQPSLVLRLEHLRQALELLPLQGSRADARWQQIRRHPCRHRLFRLWRLCRRLRRLHIFLQQPLPLVL